MSDAGLHTLTPISSDEIIHALADATEKMKDYCRNETAKNILYAYSKYNRWFGLLKNPPLIEWCSEEISETFWTTTRARMHSFTWTYEEAIESYIYSAKHSKTNIVYLSDKALKEFKCIIYRTTHEDVVNEINLCKLNHKELWDYIVEKKIVR